MDKVKQRIAIAQVCGWKFKGNYSNYTGAPMGFAPDIIGGERTLSDYLVDLNEMHKAESFLNEDQFYIYYHNLIKIWSLKADFVKDIHPIRATAEQRAEAFLKTLNLWKE